MKYTLKNKIYFLIGLLFIMISLFLVFINNFGERIPFNDKLIVHFLDVSQGDATFIELPNGKTMLIDGGEYNQRFKVYNCIQKLGYKQINFLVATHPHSDHIGSLSYIVDKYEVINFYMPNVENDIPSYNYLKESLNKKNIEPVFAKSNVDIIDEDNLKVYFVSPSKDSYEEINGYCAVLKIEYGDNSFLFMGDALKENEDEIMGITADVVKVGHHGSFSSSSIEFVHKVKAKYAIISAGNNDYNLPRIDIIKRWERSGAIVYRTDINGDIKVISDGINIIVEKEK